MRSPTRPAWSRGTAPGEARVLRFGRPGEIAELFTSAGLVDIVETELRVSSTHASFDELWNGFLAGVGPIGSYCVSPAARWAPCPRDAPRADAHVAGVG